MRRVVGKGLLSDLNALGVASMVPLPSEIPYIDVKVFWSKLLHSCLNACINMYGMFVCKHMESDQRL